VKPYTSAFCSIVLLIGVLAPCSVSVSIRISVELLPCCNSAADFNEGAGTTYSS
jgi:hypothetical protein